MHLTTIRQNRPKAGLLECAMTFTTDFNNGLFLRIEWTNPSDPVRNIRVFMPGFDEGIVVGGVASAAGPWPALPFHPHILGLLAPFPALRFMDWSGVNSFVNGSLASRPVTTRRSFAQVGPRLEETSFRKVNTRTSL